MNQVKSWHEAIVKQRDLCQEEQDRFPDDPSSFFDETIRACDRALELWHSDAVADASAKVKAAKAQLEQAIEAHRMAVGHQLSTENDGAGWQHVADELKDKDSDMNRWLQW